MVPQLDVSFFVSQLFWLLICLIILFVAFNKVFIPKINTLMTGRKEYIDSLKNDVKDLEKQIVELCSKLKELKQKKVIETNKIIAISQKKCDVELQKKMEKLQRENEITLKQTRQEASDILNKLEKSMDKQIDEIANKLFDRLFKQGKD